jgi:hypothetical protein
VVHVPAVADEDRQQMDREMIELKAERTELLNRSKGLLAGLGLNIVVDDKLPGWLSRGSRGGQRTEQAFCLAVQRRVGRSQTYQSNKRL